METGLVLRRSPPASLTMQSCPFSKQLIDASNLPLLHLNALRQINYISGFCRSLVVKCRWDPWGRMAAVCFALIYASDQ